MPPFFSLHLPPLGCLSSHLKCRLSLVCIFHLSLLGVSQATSSAAFLQSASSISPYLVSLKPPQCRLSLVCIFHLSLLGVSQATSMPPFFSLHLPPLPTWCLSSHLNAAFLQSASSISPYLVSLKPPQVPPFFSLHLPSLPTWCLSSHLKPAFLQSASSTSPYLVSLKPPQARPFFSLHLPPLPTWCLSSHLKRRLSLVCIFHLSLLGVSQATSMPPFFSLHLPPLPTWCLSSHLKRRLSLVCIFHLSLLGVSQATSSAAFLQSASSTSPYLVSLKPPQAPPFFSLHLPPLPTWCLSSHLKPPFLQSASSTSPYLVSLKPPQAPPFFSLHLPPLPTWCLSSHLKCRLSLVCIFHLSLLGVSQATSMPPFFSLHLPPLPTWCLSSHLKRRLSLVCIFHSPYLVSLKPPQVPPFFSLHLPSLPTWCLSSHLNATFLQSASSTWCLTSMPPFFSLHLPPLPTWCLSSHLNATYFLSSASSISPYSVSQATSSTFLFHLSLLGVSQATSSAAFLQSASSTSPYLVSLKPPQARPFFRLHLPPLPLKPPQALALGVSQATSMPPFFSLHLPPLPTWCLSSHLNATFLQSASSTSPYLVSLKPPQLPPFFRLHLPSLPTWCLSSHLKRRLSLVCIFHLSLLGVSQATSSPAFLQSASSTSPYLVSLKPPQAGLSLVCIFHLSLLGVSQATSSRPFFSLHLPPLPTWCLSSHLNAAFLQSASSTSPYLVSLKPPQCRLSLVCIFHLSLLGVSQATSSAAFLQSASSTSPYLVSLKPPQVPPFFSLHLPSLPTWCLSSHLNAAFLQSASSISPYLVSLKPPQCRLSLVCIFHLSLLGVSQATSMPPFFSLHLPSLPTWCLSSHLNAAFLQSASSISPYLVSLKPPQVPPFFSLHLPPLPTWCLSSHLKCRLSLVCIFHSPYLVSLKPPQVFICRLSLVCIFHLSLLGVSQATSSPAFLQSASSISPYLVSLKPPQAGLSLVCIFHLSLLGVSQATSSPPFFSLHLPLSLLGVSQATSSFLQSASSISPYLVSLKPPQVPPFFSLHLPPLPTCHLVSLKPHQCHLSLVCIFHLSLKPPQCHLSLVCIFHLCLLGVSQATSMPPFFSLHLPPLPTWCLSSLLNCRLSFVCIFHLSLLGVSQASSTAAFLSSASSISPYLVSLKPPQARPFFSLHLPPLPTWCLSSHLKPGLSFVCIFHHSLLGVSQATSSAVFLQSSSSTSAYLVSLKPPQCHLSLVCIFHLSLLGVSQASSTAAFLSSASSISPYLVSLKPPQAPPFFSLHLPPLPTWCLSSHLKCGLSFVCIFHLSLLGVSQATSSAAFLSSASSTSPYLVSLKPPQARPFFRLHLPPLPTWCLSSHLKCRLSLVCIFHLSLLGVSQATSIAAFLQSASSISAYLVSLKPPQVPPFFSLHLPHLPTWCLSSHLKCRLSLVCIFHLSLLGVSQATSMLQSASHLSWCLSSLCIFQALSLVCIFHLSLLGVSQATSSPAFLQSASSISPYLVSLKPPQCRLSLVFIFHLSLLGVSQATSMPPFFRLHLPSLPTWCLSSHLKRRLSLVCIFHLSLLGVSQATSSGVSQAFLSPYLVSASSTSPYLVSLKPPQCHLSLVCIFHLSLLGVSQATSSRRLSLVFIFHLPYLVSLKPPQVPPFFSLHLPSLPTWCLSSHLKHALKPGFLQSASSISPYLVSLKPPQVLLSLVCIFHLSLLGVSQATSSPAFLSLLGVCIFHPTSPYSQATSMPPFFCIFKPLGVSQATSMPPFFSLHLPPLPTWCLSSHLNATFLQSASSTSPYLVSLKPPQLPPFFRLHLPSLPTWCLSSLLNCRLSFVCIFHLSLLGVSQATSSPAFLQSASSTSPYLVSLKPSQARPFFRLHLPPLPTWCLSSHLKRRLSLVFIFHLCLLGVSQATSMPPFFSLHIPPLPTWCLSSLLNCRLSFVCIFHLSLLGVSQATSSATFLQSASSTSPYLVSPPLPTWCLSSHLKCGLSFVCIFHLSLLGVSQATSSAAFLSSASSTSLYLVSLKPPQARPFFRLHLPPLPTWCLSSHLKCRLSLVCIFHLSLLGVSQATSIAAFLQSASSISAYLVSLKPPQVPPFFSLHLPHLPTWCLSSHLKCRLSLVCIFHLSLLGVYQATSSPEDAD